METIKEKEWKTKFLELPFLLKFVVVWVYLISIERFFKFFFSLIFQLSIDPFALALGYLIWVLAGGLVNRDSLARIIALICSGFNCVVLIYGLSHGGIVSLDGLKLRFLYPNSLIWIVANSVSALVLLHPKIGKLYSSSNEEK